MDVWSAHIQKYIHIHINSDFRRSCVLVLTTIYPSSQHCTVQSVSGFSVGCLAVALWWQDSGKSVLKSRIIIGRSHKIQNIHVSLSSCILGLTFYEHFFWMQKVHDSLYNLHDDIDDQMSTTWHVRGLMTRTHILLWLKVSSGYWFCPQTISIWEGLKEKYWWTHLPQFSEAEKNNWA